MKTVGDKFPAFSLPGIDENNEFVQVDIHESYTPHKKDWSEVYFYPKLSEIHQKLQLCRAEHFVFLDCHL